MARRRLVLLNEDDWSKQDLYIKEKVYDSDDSSVGGRDKI